MQRYTFVFRSRQGDIEWALVEVCLDDAAARRVGRKLLLVADWPVVDVWQSARHVAWYETATEELIPVTCDWLSES